MRELADRRPRWSFIAVTVVAAAISLGCFVAGYPTVIHDSWGYYFLANHLRTLGFSEWPAAYRSYGYPFFAALVTGFRAVPPEEYRVVVYLAQLAAYLLACGLLARRLGKILGSPTAASVTFAVAALNPVLLLHTTEPLSDLLSAALVLLALVYSWRLPAAARRLPAREAPGPAADAFRSFFCAGASVAIRPANLVVAAALVAVWIVRAGRWRDVGARTVLAAVAGLIPPFVPQVILNHATRGSWSPLIPGTLYREQAAWGMGVLKYGTLVMPDRSPFLVYSNPFYRGDLSPAAFLRNHPGEYAQTLLGHGFALLDRDLPFTYVTDLDPWYRWPLAAVNFVVFYAAAAGVAVALVRLVRRRSLDEPGFVVASTAAVAVAYALLYLPIEVEARFGLVLTALAAPLIVAGLNPLAGPGLRRARARWLLLAGAPFVVGAALWLSSRMARHRINPVIDSPANVYTMNPPHRGVRRPP